MKNKKIANLKVSASSRLAEFTIELFNLEKQFAIDAKMSCDFVVHCDSEDDGSIEVLSVFDSEDNEVKLPDNYISELESKICTHIDFYCEYYEKQIARAEAAWESNQDR